MGISFGKKILIGFALSISVFGLIGVASYLSGVRYADSTQLIERAHQAIESVEGVLSDLKDAETGGRGFAISNDDAYLEPYNLALQTLPRDLARLHQLVEGNTLLMEKADTLGVLAKMKMDRIADFIRTQKLKDTKTLTQLIVTGKGKKAMDNCRAVVREMISIENSMLGVWQQQLKNDSKLNSLVNIMGLLGALSLFVALYFLLRTEITRRNDAEGELRKINAFLSTILENIPNMIFVKEAKHLSFIRFNKAGEDLLGYSRAELLGKSDSDLFPKEQADFFVAKDREVLKKGILENIPEEPIQTRHKGIRWLHTQKLPVLNESGEVAFLLGISDDITELKKQQDAIRQLNNDLEAFSYSVSHDLRAPLRGINGIAKILEEQYGSRLDAEGIHLLGLLRSSSQSMTNLIQDLLAFAYLGKQEINRQVLDMTLLVQRMFDQACEDRKGKIPEFVLPALPEANADPAMLNQVLINLFSNALKYSGKEEKPRIEVGFDQTETETIYFVKDNGAGFDMKFSNKLFSVFQRLHQQSEFEGSGVGLAIVERIITKHGGRVWAEAVLNGGATFYFSLPKNI